MQQKTFLHDYPASYLRLDDRARHGGQSGSGSYHSLETFSRSSGPGEASSRDAMPKKTVTLADIAKVAGVSKNTVSLALRQSSLISKGTRERVCTVAEQLGYERNATLAHLMTQLRSGRTATVKAALALLNANVDRQAFQRHPTVPTYVEGCRRRAAELGYGLNDFWLHEPALNAARLQRIFEARGIQGIIVVGLLHENHLPAHLAAIWDRYPCVVTGVSTQNPALSSTATDQYELSRNAVEQALRMGYRRPALVLDRVIDAVIGGRYSAGVHVAQQRLPAAQRTHPLYLVKEAKDQPAIFRKWLEQENPDVILTLHHTVKKWLIDLKYRVPEDVGLIQLEWRPDHADWAGMNQHNDVVGESAVEMVVGMIHKETSNFSALPQSRLTGSTWIEGKTVKPFETVPVA